MEELRKVILLILFLLSAAETRSEPQVPCFFIFGDSLVDNGNNNGLLTLARANYMPYGVDFSEGPSGRFNNGRTTVDVLAQLLGFRNFIPSYSTVQRNEVLRGVNFASGAAGIRDETGNNLQLYELGARKVAAIGLGEIGCIPYELARLSSSNNKTGSRCNEKINKAINIFNIGLLQMVKRFNRDMEDAMFIYVNTYESSKDLVKNAMAYGFNVVDKGCCGVGRNNGQITCLPLQTPCANHSSHLFWDAFHPTEAANQIYATKAYNSTSSLDVYPMNIKQLALA
ncbi:GDSL esterase/lipase [Dendrobium catenatum]|uniref:GDSL esterase/lipase n=1 Tax=Dendrobium catenatum TaxID=906689 RepID=A0A2I0WCJ5_9ASPA|nr:GDSL esterase/lipase [Dendrobium catenatum]